MNSKKPKKILIISLEGIESNTEINFFRGLFDHQPNYVQGECKALGKLSNKQNMQAKFKNRLESLIRSTTLDFMSGSQIFFIGDGYPESDLVSMKNARDFIVDYFEQNNKLYEVKISHKIIYDPNKSFENILFQNEAIKKSNILSKKDHKKRSYYNLFNNLIEAIDPTILTSQKGALKSILLQIFKNSNFKKIIDFIYN